MLQFKKIPIVTRAAISRVLWQHEHEWSTAIEERCVRLLRFLRMAKFELSTSQTSRDRASTASLSQQEGSFRTTTIDSETDTSTKVASTRTTTDSITSSTPLLTTKTCNEGNAEEMAHAKEDCTNANADNERGLVKSRRRKNVMSDISKMFQHKSPQK